MDILIDSEPVVFSARGRAGTCDPGRHLPAHPLHPARQQSEVPAPCILHQGNLNICTNLHVCSPHIVNKDAQMCICTST